MAYTNPEEATLEPSELIDLLKEIQSTTSVINQPISAEDNAARAHLIEVDWDTRMVTLPSAYSSYLSVATDHRAATVFFECDRYYDNVDLTEQSFAVEYVNASGEGRIYPVVDFDYITDPNKIVFGWKIGHDLTKKSGEIKFMVHVFSVNPETNKYTYSLHTQPCSAKILKTLDIDEQLGLEDLYGIDAEEVASLFSRLAQLEKKAVAWYDLIGGESSSESGSSSNNNNNNNNDDDYSDPGYDPSYDDPDYWMYNDEP